MNLLQTNPVQDGYWKGLGCLAMHPLQQETQLDCRSPEAPKGLQKCLQIKQAGWSSHQNKQSIVGIVVTITGSCKNGSRTFVLSNLYHHIKILQCIELENGIWESLINTWARIRQGYHLSVKVIEILLLRNVPNHCWTININAYRWKGFSDYRTIARYY